ncbi:hypothetical protein VZT92_017820 [Zoarces viviparus]|uniref:Uncharacterized protein n=1 Tax=Zoarces viviparus TaxID=48416 RepID=A0AAW1ERR0_ZOAVI
MEGDIPMRAPLRGGVMSDPDWGAVGGGGGGAEWEGSEVGLGTGDGVESATERDAGGWKVERSRGAARQKKEGEKSGEPQARRHTFSLVSCCHAQCKTSILRLNGT